MSQYFIGSFPGSVYIFNQVPLTMAGQLPPGSSRKLGETIYVGANITDPFNTQDIFAGMWWWNVTAQLWINWATSLPGTGTVTSVAANNGLVTASGTPITDTGTVGLAPILAGELMANATNADHYAVSTDPTVFFDYIGGDEVGSLWYRGSQNTGQWFSFPPGPANYVLTSHGSATDLTWEVNSSDAALWSTFPAVSNVNMANYNIKGPDSGTSVDMIIALPDLTEVGDVNGGDLVIGGDTNNGLTRTGSNVVISGGNAQALCTPGNVTITGGQNVGNTVQGQVTLQGERVNVIADLNMNGFNIQGPPITLGGSQTPFTISAPGIDASANVNGGDMTVNSASTACDGFNAGSTYIRSGNATNGSAGNISLQPGTNDDGIIGSTSIVGYNLVLACASGGTLNLNSGGSSGIQNRVLVTGAWGGASSPIEFVTGDAGTVLTSNGAGSPPSFQTNSSDASQWATFPAVADVDMNGFDIKAPDSSTTVDLTISLPDMAVSTTQDGGQFLLGGNLNKGTGRGSATVLRGGESTDGDGGTVLIEGGQASGIGDNWGEITLSTQSYINISAPINYLGMSDPGDAYSVLTVGAWSDITTDTVVPIVKTQPGAAGTVLTSQGAGSPLIWSSPGATPAVEVTGTTQLMVPNTAYVANNASLVTLTFPASCAFGSLFTIVGKGAGLWLAQLNGGQTLYAGINTSSSGGSIASTLQRDVVTIMCITANTEFQVVNYVGNLDTN